MKRKTRERKEGERGRRGRKEGREGEKKKRDGRTEEREEGRNLCKAGKKRTCLQKSGALHHASAK